MGAAFQGAEDAAEAGKWRMEMSGSARRKMRAAIRLSFEMIEWIPNRRYSIILASRLNLSDAASQKSRAGSDM